MPVIMRARKPRHRVSQTRIAGEPTEARERLERAWHDRLIRDDGLARMVTAQGARKEPFHRWLVFKQAFSPELVRLFLAHEELERPGGRHPLLDPFSGTGTLVTECARRGVRALGVEPLPAPAFVTQCKAAREVPPPPDVSDCQTWPQIAPRLVEPIHRAALICAVASQLTSAGTLNKNAPPIRDAFRDIIAMMRDDVLRPLPFVNPVLRGDGRDLSFIANSSIGGILTSPPYLSRHDYAKLSQPYEDVYASWHPSSGGPPSGGGQLPAHPRAPTSPRTTQVVPAVIETVEALHLIEQPRLADVVRAYFADLFAALDEFHRVLPSQAPCWIVIAGARLKDVYVPTDVILADRAEGVGFHVEPIRIARRVTPGARRFGRLLNVAPRESVLTLRKR